MSQWKENETYISQSAVKNCISKETDLTWYQICENIIENTVGTLNKTVAISENLR
jgi:hypothetical protein